MEQPRRTEIERAGSEMADAQGERCGEARRDSERPAQWPASGSLAFPDTDGDSAQGLVEESQPGGHERPDRLHDRARSGGIRRDWPTEPDVGRVAHGVAHRVDRIKALGNGQVARVAATAFGLLRSNA